LTNYIIDLDFNDNYPTKDEQFELVNGIKNFICNEKTDIINSNDVIYVICNEGHIVLHNFELIKTVTLDIMIIKEKNIDVMLDLINSLNPSNINVCEVPRG
jgi:S-adenosylmethionine/arginine decarboxylase-like enzyme